VGLVDGRFGSGRSSTIARPFEWTFTRQNLDTLLARIDRHEPQFALAA
jgi:hypothetical protein